MWKSVCLFKNDCSSLNCCARRANIERSSCSRHLMTSCRSQLCTKWLCCMMMVMQDDACSPKTICFRRTGWVCVKTQCVKWLRIKPAALIKNIDLLCSHACVKQRQQQTTWKRVKVNETFSFSILTARNCNSAASPQGGVVSQLMGRDWFCCFWLNEPSVGLIQVRANAHLTNYCLASHQRGNSCLEKNKKRKQQK